MSFSAQLLERQLTILCEAMAQLSSHDQSLAARITDHDAVIGMRIVLVHRYADLDESPCLEHDHAQSSDSYPRGR